MKFSSSQISCPTSDWVVKKSITTNKIAEDGLTINDIPDKSKIIITESLWELDYLLKNVFPGSDAHDPWGDIDDRIDMELCGQEVVEEENDGEEIAEADEEEIDFYDYHDEYYWDGNETNEMIEVPIRTYEVDGMDSDEYNDRFVSKSTYLNANNEINDRRYDLAQKHYRNTKSARRYRIERRKARRFKSSYQKIDPYLWYEQAVEYRNWCLTCDAVSDEEVAAAMKLAA